MFDRFDIVEAYYCFLCNCTNGTISLNYAFRKPSDERTKRKYRVVDYCYKIDQQLERLRFKPGLHLSGAYPKNLSENSKMIYMGLINKYFSH